MIRPHRERLIACLVACALHTSAWAAQEVREVEVLGPVTGVVSAQVVLRIDTSPDGRTTYQVKIGRGWSPGNWVGSGVDRLHALLIDVDFDGHADLWITGVTDGQGRERPSDFWRYRPSTGEYVFDHALSFMKNLEVDPAARVLESGVPNCGCAGRCFSYDRFAWIRGVLQTISRRAQDCTGRQVVFREWTRAGGTLRIVRSVAGAPDERTERARRTGGLRPVDWSRHDESGRATPAAASR